MAYFNGEENRMKMHFIVEINKLLPLDLVAPGVEVALPSDGISPVLTIEHNPDEIVSTVEHVVRKGDRLYFTLTDFDMDEMMELVRDMHEGSREFGGGFQALGFDTEGLATHARLRELSIVARSPESNDG